MAEVAVRNVALVGHNGAGKTLLVEAALVRAGVRDRLGSVESGTTLTDFRPEEQKRQHSISTAIARAQWKGKTINVLDAPGFGDFVGEIRAALRAADAAVIAVDGVSGINVGTERTWASAGEAGLARMVVVTRLDKERASFDTVLASLKEAFGKSIVPLHYPQGVEADLSGVIDLLDEDAVAGSGAAAAARAELVERICETDDPLAEAFLEERAIPAADLRKALWIAVRKGELAPVMASSAARGIGLDLVLDALAEGVPEPGFRGSVTVEDGKGDPVELPTSTDGPFTARVFKTATDPYMGKIAYLRVWAGRIKPGADIFDVDRNSSSRAVHIYVVQGKDLIEVDELVAGDIGALAKWPDLRTGDTLTDPASPVRFPALKLPDPVAAVSLKAETRADEDKVATALGRLQEEDLTLHVQHNAETGETVLWGMGASHLDIAVQSLAERFGVNVKTDLPKVAYRETIGGKVKAQGRHKKQTGGRGQFGDCTVRLEPLPITPDVQNEFTSEVVGGAIPTKWIPSVEKGVHDALAKGPLGEYPVIGVRAVVETGAYHDVDSSDLAFRLAGALAVRNALEKARMVLLEPILLVKIRVPDSAGGAVMGDMNSRRGRILGFEPEGGITRIQALVPEAEMLRYSTELQSLTGGRGGFSRKFDSYSPVPDNIVERALARAKEGQAA
jgi:elongation factor G